MDSWWKDEKGATLGLAAVAMIVLLGMVALAVDVGMIMTARTEAQRAADAAALAAAGAAFIGGPSGTQAQQQLARQVAADYAAEHEVMNDQVDIDQSTDVTFPGTDSVRVQVRRTSGSPDGPVGTIFARVIGFGSVNVVADATARVTYATQVSCPLPLVLVDKWWEDASGTEPGPNDTYDPNSDPSDGEADIYVQGTTGWDESDYGTQIVLKSNQAGGGNSGGGGGPPGQGGGGPPGQGGNNSGGGTFNPSWWGPWQPPGQRGASDYRTNIQSCNQTSGPYGIGDQLDNEPGNMVGPTNQGFQDLMQQDPSVSWSSTQDCVWDSDTNSCTTSSPRIRPILMISPDEVPNAGRQPITARNWAGIFVEGKQGNDWIGRFIELTGIDPSTGGGGSTGSGLIKTLQLVE